MPVETMRVSDRVRLCVVMEGPTSALGSEQGTFQPLSQHLEIVVGWALLQRHRAQQATALCVSHVKLSPRPWPPTTRKKGCFSRKGHPSPA